MNAAGLSENLRKRIILVIIGIAGYYTIPIPIGLFLHSVFRTEVITSFWFYYVFQAATISFLVGFLYLAFVKVQPSLVPQQKKFKHMIIVGILIITILSVMIPTGLIVEDWKQGQCLIKSGRMVDGEIVSGTTSSGVYSEMVCKQHCEFAGRLSPNEDKTCEFKGLFGAGSWQKTPEDFADIKDKIGFSSNPK